MNLPSRKAFGSYLARFPPQRSDLLSSFPQEKEKKPEDLFHSLQNNGSIFLMGQEANSFSQERLTKFVPQPTEVLLIIRGLRAKQRYQNPHQGQKRHCRASWKAWKICSSGSEWMLGKLCPLLGALYADIYNKDGKYP